MHPADGTPHMAIPNRRLSKRLYRLTAETLIAWGENDRLIPHAYGLQAICCRTSNLRPWRALI